MIQIHKEHLSNMTGTNRLICEEALSRGWKVSLPYLPCPHIFVDRGDGRELHLFSATPPTVSYSAAHLVDNKAATSTILVEAGIHQLDFTLVKETAGIEPAVDILHRHRHVVVKPLDGGHGKGITTGITDASLLPEAIEYARTNNRNLKGVIVQEQFEAADMHDVRIACIDGEFIAAIERIPARVYGDGKSTIKDLILSENNSDNRGEPYHSKLATINLTAAERYLGKKIQDIPDEDEEVRVIGVANYGAGGELLDVTESIPYWMQLEAVQASTVLGLDVSGVDYMIDRSIDITMSPRDVSAVIVEVNKCPALSIHDEPTYGKPRYAVKKYIDFISTL